MHFFLGSFALYFQIKLSIHGSNLNSMFASMSELELFLLTRVLTPNFNTVELVATQDRVFPYYVPNSSIKHNKSDSKDRSQEIL
jgi:hypothetical protein